MIGRAASRRNGIAVRYLQWVRYEFNSICGRSLLVHPSASSPNPCRKMNVAGLELWVGASMRWGSF